LRLFSFGGYGLALIPALALVVFGDDSYPAVITIAKACKKKYFQIIK